LRLPKTAFRNAPTRQEDHALIICELCGSANAETETECRVCGHNLQAATLPAAASIPDPIHTFAPPEPADIAAIPSHLQMSAFAQDVSTGAPPMFGASSSQEGEAHQTTPPPQQAPSFMQAERRQIPESDSPGLISASDLPDWIKQIAADDAARAEAEIQTQAAAVQADHPATIQRRQLPGETVGSGPTTTWLSKSGAAAESSEHWSSAEAASANWGVFEPPKATSTSTYQTPVPATAFVPAIAEPAPKQGKRAGRVPKPEKIKEPRVKAPRQRSDRPFYRQTAVQLAMIFALVMIAAALLLR
jgi:hypothetical protein